MNFRTANHPLPATRSLGFLFVLAHRLGAPELRCWAT
jgi:hypothetical protein